LLSTTVYFFSSFLQNVGYTAFKKKSRLNLGQNGLQIKGFNSLFFMPFYDGEKCGGFFVA